MGATAEVLRKAVGAFVAGDLATFVPMLDDNLVLHVPGTNQLSGDYKGPDEFVQNFVGKVMGLTGGAFKLEPHAFCDDEGEHGIGVYRITVTRDGKTFEYPHVNVYHVTGGKITEIWQFPGDFDSWNSFWS